MAPRECRSPLRSISPRSCTTPTSWNCGYEVSTSLPTVTECQGDGDPGPVQLPAAAPSQGAAAAAGDAAHHQLSRRVSSGWDAQRASHRRAAQLDRRWSDRRCLPGTDWRRRAAPRSSCRCPFRRNLEAFDAEGPRHASSLVSRMQIRPLQPLDGGMDVLENHQLVTRYHVGPLIGSKMLRSR